MNLTIQIFWLDRVAISYGNLADFVVRKRRLLEAMFDRVRKLKEGAGEVPVDRAAPIRPRSPASEQAN